MAGMRHSFAAYIKLVGAGWWFVGVGIFATSLGIVLDVTREDIPTWPWVVILVVTALIAPYFAFHRVYTALAKLRQSAPMLTINARKTGFLVFNMGGQAEVTADCIVNRELGEKRTWGPVPLVWPKNKGYKLALMYQESAYLLLVDLVREDDTRRRVDILFYDTNSNIGRLSIAQFEAGFEGRIGYVSIVLNSEPIWIGNDPEGQFNLQAIDNGNDIELVRRQPYQEIQDMLKGMR